MRSWTYIALLLVCGASCGKPATRDAEPEDVPRHPKKGAADDERCDPKAPRVCVGNDLVACDAGTLGRRLRTCKDGCKDGDCVANCSSAGAELIYVVDTSSNLLSFDPRKLPGDPFRLVDRMRCGRAFSPFSMSVDRHGVAWVLFEDGNIYNVSITDARCRLSRYAPNDTRTFGMGFATDTPGGTTEKLYTAGNDDHHLLSSIDTEASAPEARAIGPITVERQNPELTGTSDARLYGFYPALAEPAYVQEIDRKSGAAVGPKWTLGDEPLGTVSAYAFAQWGGKFYIFVTVGGDTSVHVIDRKTGAHSIAVDHVPYRISGAGVSTCAPEKDQ